MFLEGRLIHITALILGICTVAGAVAGVISLVLYLHDRKSEPSAGTDTAH